MAMKLRTGTTSTKSFWPSKRVRTHTHFAPSISQVNEAYDQETRLAVLLLHTENHYAPIYALRDWEGGPGVQGRQMLIALSGQRPTKWVIFREIRTLTMA
jgi:hypothetical protein